MKTYNLWLDDLRDPKEYCPFYDDGELIWVRDYDSFVLIIETRGLPKIVSFDHDLGEGKDGKDCANFLVNHCMKFEIPLSLPEYFVHSQNPVGKENILGWLDNYKKFWEDNYNETNN